MNYSGLVKLNRLITPFSYVKLRKTWPDVEWSELEYIDNWIEERTFRYQHGSHATMQEMLLVFNHAAVVQDQEQKHATSCDHAVVLDPCYLHDHGWDIMQWLRMNIHSIYQVMHLGHRDFSISFANTQDRDEFLRVWPLANVQLHQGMFSGILYISDIHNYHQKTFRNFFPDLVHGISMHENILLPSIAPHDIHELTLLFGARFHCYQIMSHEHVTCSVDINTMKTLDVECHHAVLTWLRWHLHDDHWNCSCIDSTSINIKIGFVSSVAMHAFVNAWHDILI